jgi:hypothetical protein
MPIEISPFPNGKPTQTEEDTRRDGEAATPFIHEVLPRLVEALYDGSLAPHIQEAFASPEPSPISIHSPSWIVELTAEPGTPRITLARFRDDQGTPHPFFDITGRHGAAYLQFSAVEAAEHAAITLDDLLALQTVLEYLCRSGDFDPD